MDLIQAIKERHSVRSYIDRPIEEDLKKELEDYIEGCNKESGLHIQLITNERKAFDSFMAHYGSFSGISSYIALIGKNDAELEEKCGYYGEKIVLFAQMQGLNTCWVALTYKKISGVFKINDGEKLLMVISLGYGKNNGVQHRSRDISSVSNITSDSPEWFKRGVESALLAPTAVNQQKFYLELIDDKVKATPGRGFYTKTDLGIVKYHFEIASGKDSGIWL